MEILPNKIELMISDLEHKIPYVQTGLKVSRIERHDWRPVWDLCKRIQSEFKVHGHFSSREEQQATWNRFQTVRHKASELADKEKDSFKFQSECIRDDIMYQLKSCAYSPLSDLIFFFDPTTVEDMKEKAIALKAAGSYLSAHKQWMLPEHKSQCFEAIQATRESHDLFWEQRRKLTNQRRQAQEQRRAENQEKRRQWEQKTRDNISRNKDKLEKALYARNKTIEHIRELEDSLSEPNSRKWQLIREGWLEEAHQKLASIEESIDRIRGWIYEDEQRLNG